MMVRIRVIQGQVLMVISQPLHKYPPAIPIHPNFGNEIAHVNLEGEKIITPVGEVFMVPKATMMDLPVAGSIQAILSSVNNGERIFPNFEKGSNFKGSPDFIKDDNISMEFHRPTDLGKTDEGVY